MDCYPSQEFFFTNINKNLLDTGLNALKTVSKEVVHQTGEFLGRTIADAVAKSNDDKFKKC